MSCTAPDARTVSLGGDRLPVTAKRLSIDVLYDPALKVDFSGKPPAGMIWLDDEHWLQAKSDPKSHKQEWLRVEAATGQSEPFFDVARAEKTIGALEGFSDEQARRAAQLDSDHLSKDRNAFLFEIKDDLYVYSLKDDRAVRLTNTPGTKVSEAAFSPDGNYVSFVRQNDLYVIGDGVHSLFEPAARREQRLTQDGSANVLNGILDWLYQEEIYGRGNFRSYWWSPDSRAIAFLQLDEQNVPTYTLVDDIPGKVEVEASPYPRAGEPNPAVKLGVLSIVDKNLTWVDLASYRAADPLVVDVAWSHKGELFYQVQDREQTWLDLDRADASGTFINTVVHESSKAWVDNHGSPKFLSDGTLLWMSERSGWKHIYRYRTDGSLIGALTSGEWEVRTVHGADEKNGWVYFSGTERSPIGSDVGRVKLDGSGFERLTTIQGTHNANFNPGLTRFIDSWSDVVTPTQVRLLTSNGETLRVIDDNPVAVLSEYALSVPEFLQVETRDGFPMEAMLIKPPSFDPARQYPVFQATYAGPHAPQVRNAWLGTSGLFLQLVAQQGVLVWVCDNRSASGKGAVTEWSAYQQLGKTELADIEDGLAWLRKQTWVDSARIGISGWSYGGYMTSYALTHSTSFAMGIAGGSVTDWRNYDTVYTERIMRTPKHNPKGYEESSVVKAAKNLSGKLLLIHGALDDNVHPQNTSQLAYELMKAGKPFREMFYPKSRHGVVDPLLVKHLRATMLEFIRETLLQPNS